MIYLSSFVLPDKKVTNPNIYPYNVFSNKYENTLVFRPVTVLYGDNGSGKSTLLNIIANALHLIGKEYATNNKYGRVMYFEQYISKCRYGLGEDEGGRLFHRIPEKSRFIFRNVYDDGDAPKIKLRDIPIKMWLMSLADHCAGSAFYPIF